jgi:hypothetical protein
MDFSFSRENLYIFLLLNRTELFVLVVVLMSVFNYYHYYHFYRSKQYLQMTIQLEKF